MISLLREKEVVSRTGRSRSTLRRMIAAGEFPQPIDIGPRAIAWPSDEIEQWIRERIANGRRGKAAA